MDFDHPGALFSSLIIGAIGTVLFFYGRKQDSPKCLFTGIALCIFPYFIGSLILMWLTAAACLGGLYAWSRAA